ncbi:ABC transporter permease subunit [bacterium]|nr:ABC transporter permease subunit [bacterium]
MPEALREPWKPLPGRGIKAIKLTVLIIVLSCMLVFVQLPLIWMIITALKQPGTAFRLQFLPSTAQASEPIAVETMPEGATTLHFEYTDPNAVTVNVAGEFNGWDKDANPLSQAVGGVWVGEIQNADPGVYAYKFVISGSEWVADPDNDWATSDGNSVIEAKEGEIAYNRPPMNATEETNKGLQVVLRLPEGQTLSAVDHRGNEVQLAYSDGAYRGTIAQWDPAPIPPRNADEEPEGPYFKVVTHRSFGEAVDALYTTDNFMAILKNKDFPFGKYGFNSLLVAGLAALLTVVICTMAGYAFAVKQFHYREVIFGLLLSSMLVPGMIYMVPQFSITLQLGWIDTYRGLILPHLANVFGLFLLRQYISQVPRDLFNAAEIDGASELRVFQNIVIPLCLPIMVTLFLLVFVTQWSNFLWQLIVTQPSSAVTTLPVGLQAFKGQYGQDWERIMAGACFSIIPIALLFLATQRFFLEGLTAGAVKE